MTEPEIFEKIHENCGNLGICNYNETGCGDCPIRITLIKANEDLEEIQEYREIGSVRTIKEIISQQKDMIVGLYNDYEKYNSLGSVEEFKKLKENRPHEHNYDNCHNYTCRMRCREEGYAMAIDKFAEKMIVMMPGRRDDILEIAKQMKGKI